jgi:hypothetical protein
MPVRCRCDENVVGVDVQIRPNIWGNLKCELELTRDAIGSGSSCNETYYAQLLKNLAAAPSSKRKESLGNQGNP